MDITCSLLIQEDIAQLQAAEKAARDKTRADRVRMLRFLKEERIAGVSQVAEVLGYSVRTVQRWWQCYRESGLVGLLAPPRRRGIAERITPEAWEGLQAEMRAGHIGGLHEAQTYLRDTWHIGYGIDAISKLFRRRRTKLNARATARPPAPPSRRHSKNELHATVSRLAVRRVFAMDEARFGLKVTHRRLWCPFGSRPPWTHDHQYHWFWLYAAVEPVSGTCFVLFLPHVDGLCFQRFLEEFRKHAGADTIGLVLDNSGSHISGKVRWPDGLEKIPLPPYSPELNPAERWFEALRRIFANAIFDTLDDLEAALTEALRPYWQNPAKLQRLVGYPWWCGAMAGSNTNSTQPA